MNQNENDSTQHEKFSISSPSPSTSSLTSPAPAPAPPPRRSIVYIAQSLFRKAVENIRESYRPLLMAQSLSFLLAASGAANASLHFECNLSAPTMQAGLVYFALMFHLFAIPSIPFSSHNHNQHPHQYEHQHENQQELEQENEQGHSNIITSTVDLNASMTLTGQAQQDNDHHSYSHPRPPVYINVLFCRRIPIYTSIKVYILMAILDVEANYLTYLAFRYTTLTSVSLLDALAIPSAMVCSKLILKRIYSGAHYVGALVCIIGITVNVLGDAKDDENGHDGDNNYNLDDIMSQDQDQQNYGKYPHKVSGDIAAIAGALLYGLNDVLTERIVKKQHDVKEYLGMVGLFGSMLCFVQALIFERKNVLQFFHIDAPSQQSQQSPQCSVTQGWTLLSACVVLGVVSYAGMSRFLIASEAALLNLSLLTGDLWAALFSLEAEQIMPSSHFWVSLIMIVVGVFVYEMASSPFASSSFFSSRTNLSAIT